MSVEGMVRRHDLKPTYDIVIIGSRVHGLAIADLSGVPAADADRVERPSPGRIGREVERYLTMF
jgi:hypothetical protein